MYWTHCNSHNKKKYMAKNHIWLWLDNGTKHTSVDAVVLIEIKAKRNRPDQTHQWLEKILILDLL